MEDSKKARQTIKHKISRLQMRTLQEKYNGVLEGKFSKTQFRRDAAIEMPQFVSTVNSFDDTVAILKNKGAITEAKAQEPKYSTAKPADTIAPDVLDTASPPSSG